MILVRAQTIFRKQTGKLLNLLKNYTSFDCELESYLSDNYVKKIYIEEYIQLVDEIYEKYVPSIYLRRNYMAKEDMKKYIIKEDMLQYMKKEDMLQYMNKKTWKDM